MRSNTAIRYKDARSLSERMKNSLGYRAMSHSTSVFPSTVFHDRTWSLSTNSGHCLEKRKEPHLGDEDIATSSYMVRNSSRFYVHGEHKKTLEDDR